MSSPAGWPSRPRPTGAERAWELCLYDRTPPRSLGADGSLLASGRIDNQVSCWAATDALLAAPDPSTASR